MQIPHWIHPHIVYRARHKEVRWRMECLHTHKVFPPCLKVGMRKRNRINPILCHERMRHTFHPMRVKLFLQEMIHSSIE